jgi:hypothetical protein
MTSLRDEVRAMVREELGEELAKLQRNNEALLGELERRRLEAEKPQCRAWWKWFGQVPHAIE